MRHRTPPSPFAIIRSWDKPEDDKQNLRWTRDIWDAIRPFSNGAVYLNFPGLLEEGESVVQKALGVNYERLQKIKGKYDPDNLFHLNQNIKPVV